MNRNFINENKFTNFYRINSTENKTTKENDKSLVDSLIGYNILCKFSFVNSTESKDQSNSLLTKSSF